MKLSHLRFDTPHNACYSLRTIAELVRQGDLVCREGVTAHSELASILNLEIIERVRPVLDLSARERQARQLPGPAGKPGSRPA